MGAMHGIVVSGRTTGDWTVVGIDHKGHLGLWETRLSAGEGVTSKRVETIRLDPPCARDENPYIVIHVHPDARLEIRVGRREVVETRIQRPLVGPVFAGIFVKDGRTTLDDAVVELYP